MVLLSWFKSTKSKPSLLCLPRIFNTEKQEILNDDKELKVLEKSTTNTKNILEETYKDQTEYSLLDLTTNIVDSTTNLSASLASDTINDKINDLKSLDDKSDYFHSKQARAFQQTVTLSDKEFKNKFPNLFKFRDEYFTKLFFFVMRDPRNLVAEVDIYDPYNLSNWLTLEGILKMSVGACTDIGKTRYKSNLDDDESDDLFHFVNKDHLDKLEFMKIQLFKVLTLIESGKNEEEEGFPMIYGDSEFMKLFCEINEEKFNELYSDISDHKKKMYEIVGELVLDMLDGKPTSKPASREISKGNPIKNDFNTDIGNRPTNGCILSTSNSLYSDILTDTESEYEITLKEKETEADERPSKCTLSDLIDFLVIGNKSVSRYPFLKEIRLRFFRYACGVIIEADLAYELRLQNTGIIP